MFYGNEIQFQLVAKKRSVAALFKAKARTISSMRRRLPCPHGTGDSLQQHPGEAEGHRRFSMDPG